MATKILLKKSTTAGAIPLTTDLDTGEIAINLADRKIYVDNGTTVERLDGAYIGADAPSNPTEGDLWYDTGNDTLKAYNGSSFQVVGYTSLSSFGVTASAQELNRLDGITATTTELNYTDGVTSNIQTQLDDKSDISHNHSLDSLSNTSITSNTSGEILKWNGSAWVNNTLSEAGIQPAGSYLTGNQTITLSGDLSGSGTTSINAQIESNAVGAAELNVTGNGTTAQFLRSDGDGSFTWATPADTTYTGGTGITVSGGTISVDLDEVATDTAVADNEYMVFVDTLGNTQKALLQNINLGNFNNNLGYITGYTETDTLDSVTDRGASTTNGITVGSLTVSNGATVGTNLTVTGNLTVNGTTTTVNSNTVNIGDNIIVLNADEAGTPSQDAGFEVERGTSANVSFTWNETDDYWSFGGQTIGNLVLDGGTY